MEAVQASNTRPARHAGNLACVFRSWHRVYHSHQFKSALVAKRLKSQLEQLVSKTSTPRRQFKAGLSYRQ